MSGILMKHRVLEAFAESKNDTVTITHGGVIAVIMAYMFPEESKSRYDWQPKPGHGYAITNNIYRSIP